MESKLTLKSKRLKHEKKVRKVFMLVLIILMLLLLLAYFVVGIIYNRGNFSITLDKNLYFDKGLIVYDDSNYKVYRTDLYAEAPETFDNIYYKWLPDDLHNHEGGSHNGKNYLAYTFYIENTGEQTSDYWTELVIDDVIKNVDDAVRIRVYKNGQSVTYAKRSANGAAEPDTVPFVSDELIIREHIINFEPGNISKYTIVLWIEGSDPECTDNILGGEFKVHMDFKSENTEEGEGLYEEKK
jgi:hypothetical protein